MNALLCKEELEESYPFLQSLSGALQGEEKLQLHIDCMNSLGEIVSLEDVNDLGGAVSVLTASSGFSSLFLCHLYHSHIVLGVYSCHNQQYSIAKSS